MAKHGAFLDSAGARDKKQSMSFVRCLQSLGSGKEYPPNTIMNLCPIDQKPVQMVLDLDRIKKERRKRSWYHPERKDMWRFGALLPLDIDDFQDRKSTVSLGEGYTPLLDYSDHSAANQIGFRLEIKEEGRPYDGFGANPTQSFKDRGISIVVSMAKKLGLQKLAIPTQGNAGDSLAEYALRAELEAAVVMPSDTPAPILNKVSGYATTHSNIHLDVVKGTIREAELLVKEKYLPLGYFSVATFQEPGWRIEGKKTMGLELAEPGPGKTEWKLPDVIVYPCGGGTGIVGMWKAFDELEALDLIGSRRPRIVAVQSEATSPVVQAFRQRASDTKSVNPGKTIAVGLNVPGGVGHFQVLRILYESGGIAISVSEDSIQAELREAYRKKGWRLGPEGAATLAALPELIERKIIRTEDHVVVFNTCSAEKYLSSESLT
ncbi:MAG TPA: threonine synthase [Bdellovibrionota bacterium]|nr:threonine synthase [Bdellovibrionota bacterium]